MEQIKNTKSSTQQLSAIALFIILSCFALFSLDKGTHAFSDLFKPGNLVALIVYFIPTFLISGFLYEFLSRKRSTSRSILLSLIIGIPLSFTLIIIALINLKKG